MKLEALNTLEGRALASPELSAQRGPRVPIVSVTAAQQHRPAGRDALPRVPILVLALALVLLTGCASAPPRTSAPSGSEQVKQRLAEIFDAAETKDLPRLDSYHWYGPHFTKFSSTGHRLDAAAAREGEHKGLSALAGLKLRTEDLQIDVFDDAAVATFTMVATIGGIGGTSSASPQSNPVTKRERGTLVFVKHDGSWKIVHEHFSAAE